MGPKFVLFAAVCVCVMLVVSAAPQRDVNNNCARPDCHTTWGGCECQCGGERGGHCHCAFGREIGDCRHGGNHMICFPHAHEQQCVSRGIERPANPMFG
ncbi:hypothetical protein Bhyg_15228 [Pseudolycoriella hygida]|uniref:Uncharacterized protein n=1 Tax=Pseudolycoriella hygida TaxID=35572 RepID=A0A9Q0MUF5_9DIPT|nr:hypothetical protein Bhyg_15228 [Pseudolycoriella hygida]